MAKEEDNLRRPTDAELEILNVLWRRGPSSVRDVHDEMKEEKGTGYTTVLKLLQKMLEKGLVKREEKERAHVYEAAYSHESSLSSLVNDFMKRAFSGSAKDLVLYAISSGKPDDQELDQIKKAIEELQKDKP